jgi:hypothetical protein
MNDTRVRIIALLTATVPEDRPRGSAPDPLLRLRLFGQMEAIDASGQSVLPRARKTRAVLAILALAASRPVLRTQLTGLLWSLRAQEQARASLRQSVHELQRALGPNARALLRTDRNRLVLDGDRLWVDACVLAQATVSHPYGLELFHPTMLDDLIGLDPSFDGWLAEQRQCAMQGARSHRREGARRTRRGRTNDYGSREVVVDRSRTRGRLAGPDPRTSYPRRGRCGTVGL